MTASNKSSPWIWFTLILLVAMFAAFILFLDQKIVKSGRQQPGPAVTTEISSEPVIDFYTVLQDREVEVPVPIAKPREIMEGQPLPARKEPRFLLQAGSFREMKDADRRKAELALLGLEAAIKRAEVDGELYHRVELGPFSDDGFYSEVRNRLIANDIQFIAKSAN